MLQEEIRIPRDRVGVIIGSQGSTRRTIERKTQTRVGVDSKEGQVRIEAENEAFEGFMRAQQIVKAIGRGFAPEKAMKLLEDNYLLDIIDLQEEVGKRPKTRQTKKGRVIGKDGSIRNLIEAETDSYISVYGKTVAIIAPMESIERARDAVEMLLKGATHIALKKFLSKREKVEKFSL